MASKQHPTDQFPKKQRRFVQRYTDMLWEDPANTDLIGPGHRFPTKAALTRELLVINRNEHWIGLVCGEQQKGTLIPGRTLFVPKGFHFAEIEKEVNCTPFVRINPQPTTQPARPAPVRKDNELEVERPYEFLRQDSPTMDGKNWRPGTTLHALETLARSGLNPQFTEEYYALKNVAARHSVVQEKDSGMVDGGLVNGNRTPDFKMEGRRTLGFGSDSESGKDNKTSARRDDRTGRNTLLGSGALSAALGNPFGEKQRGFVTGHIAEIQPDGTMVRAENMPIEVAIGGRYAYQVELGFLRANVPLPIPGFLPVGLLKISPQKQDVLPGGTDRSGRSANWANLAAVNEAGWNNAFRDQQTTTTGPLESPDRIYAYTDLMNSEKVYKDAMRNFATAPDLASKEAAAVTALRANLDSRNNLLVKRVDSAREPMAQNLAAMRSYFEAQGLDLAKIDAQVAQAPSAPIVDMPQEQLEKLQFYKALDKSRYAGIVPGQTNAAYRVASEYARPIMNQTEATIAAGKVKPMLEADQINLNYDAAKMLAATPKANETFAEQIGANRNLGIQVFNVFRDMPKNPHLYGFKSSGDAKDYIKSFVGDNNPAYEELTIRGDTTPIPVITRDSRNAGRLENALPALQAKLASDPQAFGDFLERTTNPAYGTDKQGRSDGRRYGNGIFGAIGVEHAVAGSGAKDGDLNPSHAAFDAIVAPESRGLLRRAIEQAGARREDGASNVSTYAVQTYDNLTRVAQLGQKAATDSSIVVVNQDDPAALDALRAQGAGGEKLRVIATSAAGVDIFNAARKGDIAGVYNGLLQSEDARTAGRGTLAVLGLNAHPAQARDAVLLTLLREPNAFDGAFKELDSLDKSVVGDKYGALRGNMKDAREAAQRYQKSGKESDLNDAVRDFAVFFANMEAHSTDNQGAQRANAWKGFLKAAANNPESAAAIVNTVAMDKGENGLRNSLIASAEDTITATGNTRQSHHGKIGKGEQIPTGGEGDEVYTSRFFSLATDKNGKVKSAGLFNSNKGKIVVGNTEIATALSGNVDAATAAAVGLGTDQNGAPPATATADVPAGAVATGTPATDKPLLSPALQQELAMIAAKDYPADTAGQMHKQADYQQAMQNPENAKTLAKLTPAQDQALQALVLAGGPNLATELAGFGGTTPTTGTPATGTPATATPATGTATTGTPATATPTTGTPATGTPATATPATGTPATATPATGTPSTTGTPATPTVGTPPLAGNPALNPVLLGAILGTNQVTYSGNPDTLNTGITPGIIAGTLGTTLAVGGNLPAAPGLPLWPIGLIHKGKNPVDEKLPVKDCADGNCGHVTPPIRPVPPDQIIIG